MRYYCTYFDSNYTARALALHESLQKWAGEFRLFALCLDEGSMDAISALRLPSFHPISLTTLEQADPELAAVKGSRSKVEYYFTLGPSFLCYLLAAFPEIDLLTHVDADMCFFSDPEPVFEEIGAASVAITEHRFSKRHEDRLRFGRFNVGWLTFRNDADAIQCLEWWRARCIEWCYDRLDGERYADQKYLNSWPTRFKGIHIIRHSGVNVAPWNIDRYRFRDVDGQILVDSDPLVCFHFHGFKKLASWIFDTNLGRSHTMVSDVLRKRVCASYIRFLERHTHQMPMTASVRKKSLPKQVMIAARNAAFALASRGYIIRLGDRII